MHRLHNRVISVSASLLLAGLLVGISPVAAADTSGQLPGPVQLGPDPTPLTLAQQLIVQQKLAVAQQEQLTPGSIRSIPHPAGLHATLIGANGTVREVTGVGAVTAMADPEGAMVGTTARQQAKYDYCGPAAVQVVADYIWWTDKYSQQYISDKWTKTDATQQTYVYRVRNGLNGAVGSMMPSGFIYDYKQPANGSAWHSLLRTDIMGYYMPQVASVSPKQAGKPYWLSSWARTSKAPGTYGHYIVLNGYYLVWDGTSNPSVYYDDGSGGYGGSTGPFEDPATHIWAVVTYGNGYVIW